MAMGRKEFQSGAEAKAYVEKYAQRVKEIMAKIDACNASLAAVKQKAGAKVPAGFSEASVEAFEAARKDVLSMVKECERQIASAKQDLQDTARLFQR